MSVAIPIKIIGTVRSLRSLRGEVVEISFKKWIISIDLFVIPIVHSKSFERSLGSTILMRNSPMLIAV
jgi:hypothetical protein